MCSFFLSMRRPLISTLFPYTTLFRSPVRQLVVRLELPHLADGHRVRDPGEHAQRLEVVEPHQLDDGAGVERSEEHTSELQSHSDLVCRLLLEKKKKNKRKSGTPQYDKRTTHTSAP